MQKDDRIFVDVTDSRNNFNNKSRQHRSMKCMPHIDTNDKSDPNSAMYSNFQPNNHTSYKEQ